MSRDQNRATVRCKRLDHVFEQLYADGVDVDERLVENEHARPFEQRERKIEPLLHALGIVLDLDGRARRYAGDAQRRTRRYAGDAQHFAHSLLGHSVTEDAHQFQVVVTAESAVKRRRLDHRADAFGRLAGLDEIAVDLHASAVGNYKTANYLHQRTLTLTVEPEQTAYPAVADDEVDALEDVLFTERFFNARKLQHNLPTLSNWLKQIRRLSAANQRLTIKPFSSRRPRPNRAAVRRLFCLSRGRPNRRIRRAACSRRNCLRRRSIA